MHFHLPKPLHGWREFAGEVGIIVIGVLIALGAEQLVERWQWRERADLATDALRNEVGIHYGQASEVVMAQPCIDAQLRALQDALDSKVIAPAKTYSDDAYSRFVVRAPSRPWSDSKWTSVQDEGLASHLTKDLRENLGDHYAQVLIMRENNRATDRLDWRLNALAGTAAADAATRGALAQDIEEARGRFAYMRVVGNQILGRVEQMNLTPSHKDVSDYLARSGTLKFCRAHGLPLASVQPIKL